jgi:RNA ligase (TIGR02306 family)
MERKLATIRQVQEILPIEKADKIELCKIPGWQCVVQKGDFKVGELAVYFEVDSLLPCHEPFLFLESRGRKTSADGSIGYRLRTMKLRGVLSQGLLLPLHEFINALPEIDLKVIEEHKDFFINTDLTNNLGIKKYEAPIPVQLQGLVKGFMPSFLKKTDQERLQNLPEFFGYRNVEFEETEKIDGSSVSFYLKDGEYGVCSRNMEYKLQGNDENLYVKIGNDLCIEKCLREFGENIALQGELVGPGIQGNPLKLSKIEFYLFDVYNIDTQHYYTRDNRNFIFHIWLEQYNILHVPYIRVSYPFQEMKTIDEFLKYVEGKGAFGVEREGIVFKSTKLINGQIISFKCINNKYLLENEYYG